MNSKIDYFLLNNHLLLLLRPKVSTFHCDCRRHTRIPVTPAIYSFQTRIKKTIQKKEKITKLGIQAFFHLKSYVALSNVSWSDVLGGLEYFQNFFLVDTLQVESMWALCFVRICTNPPPCPSPSHCLSALYWFPFHLLLLAPPTNLTFYPHSSSLQKEIEPINGIWSKTFLNQTYIISQILSIGTFGT